MLYKTRGIVFHTVKYSESSVVTKIYTEKFGLRTYIVRSLYGKKSGTRAALLQHLALLDLVVYEKNLNGIQNIKEIQMAWQYRSLPYDMIKSSIILFLNELFYKAIHEEEPNEALFRYISDTLVYLDLKTGNIGDLHLHAAIGLTRLLGFFPRDNYTDQTKYFDLREGMFVNEIPVHNNFMAPPQSRQLHDMLDEESQERTIFQDSGQRNLMLEKLLEYFRLHIPGFGELKSPQVLKQILI